MGLAGAPAAAWTLLTLCPDSGISNSQGRVRQALVPQPDSQTPDLLPWDEKHFRGSWAVHGFHLTSSRADLGLQRLLPSSLVPPPLAHPQSEVAPFGGEVKPPPYLLRLTPSYPTGCTARTCLVLCFGSSRLRHFEGRTSFHPRMLVLRRASVTAGCLGPWAPGIQVRV